MGDPARWEPIRGELYWAFPEEGPTEWIEHPPHVGVVPRHELIEDDGWPESWPDDEQEEEPVEPVVEDPVDWIGAWREFDTDTPIMRAVLAERDAPTDQAEEAA